MLGFLKRNLPVFIVGATVLIIFIVVIIYSESRDDTTDLPELIRIGRDDSVVSGNPISGRNITPTPNVEVEEEADRNLNPEERNREDNTKSGTDYGVSGQGEENQLYNIVWDPDPTEEELEEKSQEYLDSLRMTNEEIDQIHGITEVFYTQDGFEPKNAKGYVNQVVVFLNATPQPIRIMQNGYKYDELADGFEIAPGGTYQFRMTEGGGWSFREDSSGDRGSIFASPAINNPSYFYNQ